jgi:beta-mannosidase
MQRTSLSGAWEFRQVGTEEWLPASVPGGVHTDLLALGRIPDPFVADNEKRVMWVAEADWEYRRTFSVSSAVLKEANVFLVCDGLDTLAEVHLNGTLLGSTNNMYRQYRWEVKSSLKPSDNELWIRFPSTVCFAKALQAKTKLSGVSQAIEGGPHVRKAPCQFGWDWGPMIPPIGVWKDLRLEGYTTARIKEVHLRQKHAGGQVSVSAAVQLEQWSDQPTMVAMTITAPDGRIYEVSENAIGGQVTLVENITNPLLWWPNGYGAQPLYKVEISICNDKKTLDQKQFRIGLRTIELRRQPDEWGESFTFVVNDVPVFAKGSDWIPADTFPTRLTRAWLSGLLESAVASHQNMLRVWGGGFYEDETFYDLCDELGILVWQDGVFACSIYPLNDPEFHENVRIEMFENIKRLRHRASLALWCGNNEMEWGWESWAWNTDQNKSYKEAYDTFFHHTLPDWVAQLDPDTAYWPSSPSSDTPFINVNSPDRGDAHYWDVWHGRKPFTAYRGVFPRFMSEFGFQSLPPLETIKTYARPEDWNMTSYIMEHHQRSGSGNGLMIGQMTDTFRMPKDFPSLVYLSMILQAEGIRYGVEHWRRNKHRVSGAIYWQLNDCWPVASWASLDYYGRWKALHYAARRFYAPVMLSLFDEGLKVGVHVTSDIAETISGQVQWQLVSLDGEVIQTGEADLEVGPYLSREVEAVSFEMSEEMRRQTVFVCTLYRDRKPVDTKLSLFVPNKHLELSNPALKVDVIADNDQAVFAVSARSLARFVELSLEGADVVFSDNYFDVPAGWMVSITAPIPAGWSIDQVKQAMRVKSLYDSF